ncbi:hypothetical protein SCB49_01197 [unidentified eubacterium SCB49]|nr:hypothetical protein SCB49_01197 [unidentified eubacterium SCB49]
MKRVITLIVAFFCLSLVCAQEIQLQENDWYIDKLLINDTEVYPPDVNCSYYGMVYFEDMDFSIANLCCDTGSFSSLNYLPNNVFELFGDIGFLSDSGCSDEEWNFFTQHNGIYFAPDNISFFNPYTYEVINNGDDLALVVTNGIGDKAYYNSVLLSAQSFQVPQISVYPNPVKEELRITSLKPVNGIHVYGINGQKLISITKSIALLDVSKLPAGVYFIEIETIDGSVVKKIVKE